MTQRSPYIWEFQLSKQNELGQIIVTQEDEKKMSLAP